jgi:hypothetical protein
MTFAAILDLLLISMLGVMIFYAMRLSRSIKALRGDRKNLEKLVNELSRSVAAAEAAIAGMRNSAKDAGQKLQDRINEGRGLIAELELMTESADGIAGRLEKSATRPGRRQRGSAPPVPPPASASAPKGGFAIRDLEFEMPGRGGAVDALDAADDEEAEEEFKSRAEKELYEALRNKRRPGAA